MTVHYTDEQVTLHLGNCIEVLREIPDASVDAVVCDPPYALANLHPDIVIDALTHWLAGDRAYIPSGRAGFMGAGWDGFVPPPAAWDECLRVLKPGGHLLAFAAPRTVDLMAMSIRLAGFEIRDSIHWIYGSGFPKGQDIGKSIDKRRDDRAELLEVAAWLAAARDAAGWTNRQIDALWGFNGMAGHWTTQGVAVALPTLEQWAVLRDKLGFDDAEILPLVEKLNARKGNIGEAWEQREVVGAAHRIRRPSAVQIAALSDGDYDLTAPATDDARRWKGWNTQLRPAHEPIIVARKSTGFNTTVANVLEHGTGALNIGACRTGRQDGDRIEYGLNGDEPSPASVGQITGIRDRVAYTPNDAGRWPTNVVFGHAEDCVDECVPGCPVAEVDAQGGDARFFPVFQPDQECDLFGRLPSCERVITAATPYLRAGQALDSAVSAASASTLPAAVGSSPPPRSSASTAGTSSRASIRRTEGSVQRSAPTRSSGWNALRASSAGSLCDSCVTAIARSVAATATGSSVLQALGLRSTDASSEQTLIRSLVLVAEDLVKLDTTSTTTRLTTSLGCVVAVIKTSTTLASPSAERRSGLPSLRYSPKAPASERPKLANGTQHTTVKPLALMRWLVRLVTPTGGTILDPFSGSGTTLEAAILEGFHAVGIEREPDYAELCVQRLSKPLQPSLFGDAA